MQKKKKTIQKQLIDASTYRKDKEFNRNQDIWKYRFIENWSLKRLATHFHLSNEEVKAIIAKHKSFFQQEYD